MRYAAVAVCSVGLIAFVACGSDYSSEGPNITPVVDGGAASSSSTSSSGTAKTDSGGGPFKEEEDLPCEGRVPSDANNVFVDIATGTDSAACGTRDAACKTVQRGVQRAYETQQPKVIVAAGTYPEALTLDGGIIVEGGWTAAGGAWTASCGADHSSIVTLQAPANANTSLRAIRGASVVRFVTFKSKGAAEPGESLYGAVVTGPDVKLALDDARIEVAAGGAGVAGADANGLATTLECDTSLPKQGMPGIAGTDGPPRQGTLAAAGFMPGNGEPGTSGRFGEVGVAAESPVPAPGQKMCGVSGGACVEVNAVFAPTRGTPGCGGRGGRGGAPGSGGGSSIGILAVNESLLITYGSTVITGKGGRGGNGGMGSDGEEGVTGTAGPTTKADRVPAGGCVNPPTCASEKYDLAGGPAGGKGGKGGKGGAGSGGAGGWSIGIAKLGGAATLLSTTTVFTNGGAGEGGGPNGPAGLGQQQYP